MEADQRMVYSILPSLLVSRFLRPPAIAVVLQFEASEESGGSRKDVAHRVVGYKERTDSSTISYLNFTFDWPLFLPLGQLLRRVIPSCVKTVLTGGDVC